MPTVQPAELWKESGRWSKYGPELLRFKDRHEREFAYGPTHEEVITDIARRELRSYKQLPVNFYQIQSKFRDEIRPRFGVMRAREFLMKDAYSFHIDEPSLAQGYRAMFDAYTRIFTRMGLKFRAVQADGGSIGGSVSQEFHVLADSGEDAIVFSDGDDYAANIETAASGGAERRRARRRREIPGQGADAECPHHCRARRASSGCVPDAMRQDAVGGRQRGRRGGVRAARRPRTQCASRRRKCRASPIRLRMASAERVREATGCEPGSIGPIGFAGKIYVDHAAAHLADFVCGANEKDVHFTGVNWGRDLPEPRSYDIRNVQAGDPSPSGRGTLEIARGIEVGHIFQLGQLYSEAMKATVLDEQGKALTMFMGCYGIGVTRVVAAAIEQNHDANGIIWPEPLAPFLVVLVPINYQKSERVQQAADSALRANSGPPASMCCSMTATPGPGSSSRIPSSSAYPHRIVIGDRGLSAGTLEYRHRRETESTEIPMADAVAYIRNKLNP